MPWLTGDVIPTETACRVIRIPDDPVFRRALSGALIELTKAENWEKFGTLTPEEQAQAFLDALWTFESDDCEALNVAIVGQVSFFGMSEPPTGWLECDGSEVLIEDYPELYAAIGDNFGMPSTPDYFKIPDLRYRAAIGVGISSDGDRQADMGQKYGQATKHILIDNLPAHTHQVRNRNQVAANFHTGTAGANPSIADVAGTTNSAVANTTMPTGGGEPLDVIQPVLALLACIYAGV
jgi:microcystin-dependent protein